jgi:hypothetical protein
LVVEADNLEAVVVQMVAAEWWWWDSCLETKDTLLELAKANMN